jgi:hypothetical protein
MKTAQVVVEMTQDQLEWLEQAAKSCRCTPGEFLLAGGFGYADMEIEGPIESMMSMLRVFVDKRLVPACDPELARVTTAAEKEEDEEEAALAATSAQEVG